MYRVMSSFYIDDGDPALIDLRAHCCIFVWEIGTENPGDRGRESPGEGGTVNTQSPESVESLPWSLSM